MLFNSYVFIFAFLPIVLAVWLAIRNARNRVWPIGWLVLASLFYYGYWQPRFLLLLLFSIGVNLLFGRVLIDGGLSAPRARVVLTLGIAFNLGLLGYFKYAGFLVTNFNAASGASLSIPSIVLPIGISFITFQKIAFLVDAYNKQVRNFSLLNYALFVTFFPQLIAGPIVHHAEMLPQLAEGKSRDVRADIAVGLAIFIVGLFKKVIIADGLAIYADAGYDTIKAGRALDAASAWIAVLSYSLQLYYDFSGYSDMAVGLARMFGIVLPVNFFSPYKAASIIEFWRRWHMTLSRFLRDYLYIPLGGSRRGPARRHVNLLVTMLLGGLWHGANWTFVLWGGLHGVMLILNHAWNALPVSAHPLLNGRAARATGITLTFMAVTLAWVPFRAETVTDAARMLACLMPLDGTFSTSMLSLWKAQFAGLFSDPSNVPWFQARELWPPILPPDHLARGVRPVGLMLLIILLATFWMPNTYQIFARFHPALGLPEDTRPHARADRETRAWSLVILDGRAAIVLSAMFVLVVLSLSRVSPFLYFQF